MKRFVKIQSWFLNIDKISAISKVQMLDINDFGVAYGFELVVDGETIPFVFADENEANQYYDEILKLILINSQIIDLDKFFNVVKKQIKKEKGVKNDL